MNKRTFTALAVMAALQPRSDGSIMGAFDPVIDSLDEGTRAISGSGRVYSKSRADPPLSGKKQKRNPILRYGNKIPGESKAARRMRRRQR